MKNKRKIKRSILAFSTVNSISIWLIYIFDYYSICMCYSTKFAIIFFLLHKNTQRDTHSIDTISVYANNQITDYDYDDDVCMSMNVYTKLNSILERIAKNKMKTVISISSVEIFFSTLKIS